MSYLHPKTDNHSLAEKVILRRKVLHEANLGPLRVLDLYAGSGSVWTELRRPPAPDPDLPEEDQPQALVIEKYTPVDALVKQHGQLRFKISPRLIAALNGDATEKEYGGSDLGRYNVVDCDCFGDPFGIWRELLFRIKKPTVTFLTRGKVTYGSGRIEICNVAKEVVGIPVEWNIPSRIELLDYMDRAQLLQRCPTAHITVGYVTETPRVDYYGVLVEPTV